MKKNLIKRFRDFWGTLTGIEQKDLWDIMTALRGNDEDYRALKYITTCRIRGELLGMEHKKAAACIVYLSSNNKDIKRVACPRDVFSKSNWHSRHHTRSAIEALARYVPKKRIKDLLNLL
jgi:hypothetical protein